MVSAGMTSKLMVPDGCMEEAFIQAAGADALNERCFVTFGGLPPDKLTGAGKEFVAKYQARYGIMPQAYAIYGYEAAKVALKAIENAGKKDRAAIVEACLSLRDFEGALGTWSFDANGDTSLRTMSGSIVRGGKFEFVKVLGQ
jgi:branched-chain amino acid transport system substrate-binding protein